MPYFFIRSLLNTLLAQCGPRPCRDRMPGCPQRPAHRPCPAPAGRPGRRDIVKGFFLGKFDHGVHVGGRDGLAVGVIADAAVAGRTPDLGAAGLFFSARMMACSRPPPPTTRIFISVLLDSTTARERKIAAGELFFAFNDGTAGCRRTPSQCRTCCRCRSPVRRGWSRPAAQ